MAPHSPSTHLSEKPSPQRSSKSTTTGLLTISKAALYLGVTVQTLRKWDREGKIKAYRSPGGHRRFALKEIQQVLGISPEAPLTLVYARVSTRKQKDNLERQVGRLLEHCSGEGWKTELFKDIGSGLNDNRKGLGKILKRISDPAVGRVVVEYKDRLTRYGFPLFEQHCKTHGVEVLVLQDKEDESFEEELTRDLVALLASFSARLYGRRGGRARKTR